MMPEIFPPVDEALEIEPEELAVFVLKYLSEMEKQQPHGFNLNNFLGESRAYSGQDKKPAFSEALTEAWMWLEREGMLLPRSGERDWLNIGRKGARALSRNRC